MRGFGEEGGKCLQTGEGEIVEKVAGCWMLVTGYWDSELKLF
ncbi:MAG TPA: hypothetical protein VLQ91_21190 [Draconibacterium sp.]|nr:hypothetical protein [Draconibacterium sp.]